MKKIYRGMQNAAEEIDGNFSDLVNLVNLVSKDNVQLIFDGATYFLETHRFPYDLSKMKFGLYFMYSRYTPGTGALDYGYRPHFIPKTIIEAYGNSTPNIVHPMLGDQFKAVSFDKNAVWGNAQNGNAPHNNYAIRKIWAV